MIRRFLVVVAWLVVGHLALGALYLALLQVPESTVWMLGLSALLAVAIAAGLVWLHVTATALWLPGLAPRGAAAIAARAMPWGVLAALVMLVAWVATARLDAWHAASRGTIDAALMARFNWAETAWVHRALDAAVFVLRYGVGVSLALSALGAGIVGGRSRLASREWLWGGLHPVAWLGTAALIAVLVFLPWQYAYWRPAGLGPRLEPVFVAAKLGTIALLIAAGWALVLRLGVGRGFSRAETPQQG